MLKSYVEGVEDGVHGMCRERTAANDDLRERVQRELGELEAARWRLDQLLHTNQAAQTRLDELQGKYGETAPEELALPVEQELDREDEPLFEGDSRWDEVGGKRFGSAAEAETEPVVELKPHPIAPLGIGSEDAPDPEEPENLSLNGGHGGSATERNPIEQE